MKKIGLLAILTIGSVQLYSQTSPVIGINDAVVGENLKTGESISGKEYHFSARLHHFDIDSTTWFVSLHLRNLNHRGQLQNKGSLLGYDLQQEVVKWSKPIDYTRYSILQDNDFLILARANKSYCYDIKTNIEKWKIHNRINYLNSKSGLAIGSPRRSDKLQGIDLKSGTIKWTREIPSPYGWDNVYDLNDTSIMIVSSGLHQIDLPTGQGWDYEADTHAENYNGVLAANAIGIGLGLLTGVFTIYGPNIVTNVNSNVLTDSTYFYFATKEKLVKIGDKGWIKWWSMLTSKNSSQSTIFKRDSFIYIVNSGLAYSGYRRFFQGQPFIAAFNAADGQLKYTTIIDGKRQGILDYKIMQDTIFLMINNKIAKYQLSTGALLSEKVIEVQEKESLRYFIDRNTVYVMSDSINQSFTPLDSGKHYLYTSNETIAVVDFNLNIIQELDIKDCYIPFLTFADCLFIEQNESTFLINPEGNSIAHLNISNKAEIFGE